MVFYNFFVKYCFFRKTCLVVKHLAPNSRIKKVILVCYLTRTLSLKSSQMRPQNSFLQFPQKLLLFPKKLFNIKYSAPNFCAEVRRWSQCPQITALGTKHRINYQRKLIPSFGKLSFNQKFKAKSVNCEQEKLHLNNKDNHAS